MYPSFTQRKRTTCLDPEHYWTLHVPKCLQETQCQGVASEVRGGRGWMIMRLKVSFDTHLHLEHLLWQAYQGLDSFPSPLCTFLLLSPACLANLGTVFKNKPGKPTRVLHLNNRTHVSHSPPPMASQLIQEVRRFMVCMRLLMDVLCGTSKHIITTVQEPWYMCIKSHLKK